MDNRKSSAVALFIDVIVMSVVLVALTGQNPKKQDHPQISVRYTDIHQAAGITFRQDATETEEKYYLETMGTGVGWIDYDQDGRMDLFFVQSGATDTINRRIGCAAPSITTMAMEHLPTLRRKQA